MKIFINDEFYVHIDNYNHTLYRKQGLGTRKKRIEAETFGIVGYYSNMVSALRKIGELVTIEEGKTLNLDGYIKQIEKANEKLNNDVLTYEVVKYVQDRFKVETKNETKLDDENNDIDNE